MPFVYLRYVFDTFVKFENKQESWNLKNQLINLRENFKFTKQEEHDNSLNFLDICVQRSVDGKLLIKIHHKLNFEALYVSWVSFGPVKQKLGVLTGVVKRIYQTLFYLLS